MFAFFAIFADFFLSVAVWSNIGQLAAELGILAVGVTVLMIAGEFDLSVGSVFGFVSGITVILLNMGMPAIAAILIALSAGAAIGTFNGYLVTTLGVHSLIITLGGLMFYRALLLVITEGFPIPIEVDQGFFDIFAARPGGLTVAWAWFIITVAVAQVLVFTTREGNWIFASGGNPLTARELGVPVRLVKIRAFALTSTLAAFAGIVQLARFNTVDSLREGSSSSRQSWRPSLAVPRSREAMAASSVPRWGSDAGDDEAGSHSYGYPVLLLSCGDRFAARCRGHSQYLSAQKGRGMSHPEEGQAYAPLVELRDVSKSFGSVTALRDVTLTARAGETVGLLGDNGAGKSALIKILSGVYRPDRGSILWEGAPVVHTSPQDAMRLGISVAYQDLAVVGIMSIYRNFFLGREEEITTPPRLFRFLKRKRAREIAAQVLANLGIYIRDVNQTVGTLSGGERQSMAIARAIHFKSKLLILDEPTSSLSVNETGKVLGYVTEARRQGVCVVLITHNLHHAYEVSDRFIVLRHGRVVGSYERGSVSRDDLAALITTGRET